MEASTTIKQILVGNKIFVPNDQQPYSWETETDKNGTSKQINVFISNLKSHINSSTNSPYSFGHFLFEEKTRNEYGVIDGQQRLTTIIIFISALFRSLKSIRELTESEFDCFEDMIKRRSTYRFATVDSDDKIFKDYVIDQIKKDKHGIETESAKKIVNTYDYFTQYLSDKDEIFLVKMLTAICEASCTTRQVIVK